jgi:hypothetical protein
MLFGPGFANSMHFDPADQAAFIEAHGSQCVVWPVLTCPCLREERQFDPLCHTCHGNGRYYPDGASYATILLLHQETSKRTFQEAGTWTEGTIQASLLPGVRMCERDKVRWVDIKDTFNDELLTRGLQDRVRFTAGVELLVVADRTQVYRPDVDYTLTPPNTVTWLPGGQAPLLARQYSVKYACFPEYLVVNDSPRLRVEHRFSQSQEVVLMRLDKIILNTV